MQPWWKLATERQYAHALKHKNRDAALQLLRRALDAAREMGLALEEGRILTALGDLESDGRRVHFSEAQRIFEERGAVYGLVELESVRSRVASTTRA